MNDLKFNIDGKAINGNAATWSIKELLGRKGMMIDFNNKTIKQVGERELSQWDADYITKTYANFNINDYTVIKDNTLKLDNFNLIFDFKNNVFNVNGRIFKIDAHNDYNAPILKAYKTKLKVFDGLQGLVKIFTDGFYKDYQLVEFLEKYAA